MSDPIDLDAAERRAARYWNVDGLPELVMGGLWILWGASALVGEALPHPIARVYTLFTPAVLVGSGAGAVWLIKRLKSRITFPRAGYVEWKPPTSQQRFAAAAVAIVAAAGLVALLATGRAQGAERVAAPGIGVLLSLAFVVASITQRAPHLLALAGVALVLGLAIAASQTGWDSMNSMLIGLGVAAIAVGAIRLRRFLRAHPLERHA